MDRRQFLHQTALMPAAAYAASSSAEASPAGQGGGGNVSLREKLFGCIAGLHVGSALKGPGEGMAWPDIQAKYGTIDKMIGYLDYHNGWNREPGTTEDGVERSKMNSRRTVRQTADGLYEAYGARLRRMRTYAEEMEKA